MSELKSEGQRLLREALKERGAAAELSRAVGVVPSVITRWLDGRQKPDTRNRIAIEEQKDIPLQSWDEAPKVDSDEGGSAA